MANPFSNNSANVSAHSAFETVGKPVDQLGQEVIGHRKLTDLSAARRVRMVPGYAEYRRSIEASSQAAPAPASKSENPLYQPDVVPTREQAAAYRLPTQQELAAAARANQNANPASGAALRPEATTSQPVSVENTLEGNVEQRLADARRNVKDSYGEAA